MLIFYATYRCPGASNYRSAAAGGGGGPRQSAITHCATPTKGMGIVWFPCGGVSSWRCQVFSEEPAPPTSNCTPGTSYVRNEPNSSIADWKMPAAGRRRRPNAQNKPNLARPDTARVAKNALRRHYKREKLCKTNPISRRAGPGRDPRGVGRGAHYAKQSQFGEPLIYAKSVCGQRLAERTMDYAAAKTKPIRGVEIASLRSQ